MQTIEAGEKVEEAEREREITNPVDLLLASEVAIPGLVDADEGAGAEETRDSREELRHYSSLPTFNGSNSLDAAPSSPLREGEREGL